MSLSAIKYFFKYPRRLFSRLGKMGLLNWVDDETYLHLIWSPGEVGYPLDLKNPQSFNAKLQWLKVHDHNPLYTTMVDKYAVKKYVADKIGEEYVIPVIGGPWKSADEIDFDALPDRFVLKCNHDSGGLVICSDKAGLDIEAARRKLNKHVRQNYYLAGREWPYKDVEPCIFAEQFMSDEKAPDLLDYKFMMFNGEFKCSFVCTNRFSGEQLNVTFFDPDWNRMPFERKYHADPAVIEKPSRYEEMIEIAKKLAEDTVFSRIDLYEINGRIYFGEITFCPGGGQEAFRPVEWDYELGSWLRLPGIDY